MHKMKKTSYILLGFAAMLGFASCSSDVDTVEPQGSGSAVVVNASVGAGSIFTRTSPIGTDEEQTQFTAGDQIGLSDGTKTVNYTLADDGKTWNATTAGEALVWQTQKMNFQAYYPVKEGNSYEGGSVELNQELLRNLKASDYMTVEKKASEPDNHALALEFERRTARVVVNIVGYNDEFDDIENESDKNVVRVTVFGSRNSTTKEPVAQGINAYNMPTTEKPNGGGKQFVALVFPTDAKADKLFLRLAVGEQNEEDMHVTGIPQLEAGKSYSYDLTLGKNTVKVENVTVADWTDGTTIDTGSGEAE